MEVTYYNGGGATPADLTGYVSLKIEGADGFDKCVVKSLIKGTIAEISRTAQDIQHEAEGESMLKRFYRGPDYVENDVKDATQKIINLISNLQALYRILHDMRENDEEEVEEDV